MEDSSNREEELFAAAISLPEREREAYLARACEGAPALHQRLTNLLRVVERDRTVKDRSFMVQPECTGDRINGYRLLEELGEGGCGVVYLAEQIEPVHREVALKVIKIGMDSKAVIARFEAERQALALMDHSNIARVLDAGTTASGRPYFVMELVRGIKITEYCNQTRLNIRERIGLFIQVCQAIQHAHYKGIVHRDIKPSNVLVTLVDGAPVVKVIDFGIAKAMQGRLTEETLLTAMEQFLGTPAYVSPEQTQFGGANVDTRSDIYSLGILLYELLSGCRPFDSSSTAVSAIGDLRERIRLEEPTRPSKQLGDLAVATLTSTAWRYRSTARKLIQEVRGDLDWIVLRCLEKEQARRYQAVNDLSADLQRHLCDEPVVARPRQFLYGLAKFARRHRAMVATATVISAVLLTSTIATTLMASRLTHAHRLAQELNALLRSTVGEQAVAPWTQSDVRPLHTRAPPAQEFAHDPLTRASVHITLASAYRSLQDSANERLHFEAALDIYREEEKEDLARTPLGGLVRSLSRDRRFVEAASVADAHGATQCKELALQLGKPCNEMGLKVALAFVYYKLGELPKSKALLEPMLERSKDGWRTNVRALALEAKAILAAVYAEEGDVASAETLAKHVLSTREQKMGRHHPETLKAAYLLSEVYASAGKRDLARAELQRVSSYRSMSSELGRSSQSGFPCRCVREPEPDSEPVRPLYAEEMLVDDTFDLNELVSSYPASCACSQWGQTDATVVSETRASLESKVDQLELLWKPGQHSEYYARAKELAEALPYQDADVAQPVGLRLLGAVLQKENPASTEGVSSVVSADLRVMMLLGQFLSVDVAVPVQLQQQKVRLLTILLGRLRSEQLHAQLKAGSIQGPRPSLLDQHERIVAAMVVEYLSSAARSESAVGETVAASIGAARLNEKEMRQLVGLRQTKH